MSKNNNVYRSYSASTPSLSQRLNGTKVGRAAVKSGYLTVETATMWIAYAVTLICNAAFEAGRLGGVSSADVAYATFTWFTPAGYVFAIWTVIYIALAVWLVWYTRTAPTRPDRFTATAGLFTLSSGLNIAWLALWHFQAIGVAFLAILALWFILCALYLRMRTWSKGMIGWAPISIYTAWVSVAMLANFAILLTVGLNGGIPVINEIATILLCGIVLAAGVAMRRRYNDVFFPLVFLWAIIGVGAHVAPVNAFVAILIFILCAIGAFVSFQSDIKRALYLPDQRPQGRQAQ